jgi:acetyl esterase
VARWVAEHGVEHGLDPERLAVAGDSVGGNMSSALTLLAKERGGLVFRSQVLFYPVTDAGMDTGSYREFATGYFLRRDAMERYWDQYTTDPAERPRSPPRRCGHHRPARRAAARPGHHRRSRRPP